MEQISQRLVSWASILDPATRAQAERASSMPFIYPHLALMPDAHLGKGATVGSVIPTVDAIIPAAVGVDIGCGMHAVRLALSVSDVRRRGGLGKLRELIEHSVPLSAGRYNKQVRSAGTRQRITDLENLDGADSAEAVAPNWRLQLGSLGSGNHFIEISLDEQDRVWLFLHSGSRGVGNKLATRHIKVAQQQCARRRVDLPDRDLAYLVEGEPAFDAYLTDLRWAQHFALLNRQDMMQRVVESVHDWYGEQVAQLDAVQCHHNYTAREQHYGKDVWLSRKGAIDARAGVPGLIPGSMATRSYVVVGTGNEQALHSAPHGAGREFSRTAARKRFTRAELDAAMAGIEWRRTDAFLDEIPAAYKPIDQVMHDAAELVEIRHALRQIVSVKGD